MPSVGQQDTAQLRVGVKAACGQASTLTWPHLMCLHSSLPHPPIKLPFQILLWLGVSVLHALMGESWVPALTEIWGVGMVQNPGWMLGGSGKRPGTPGGATGQTGWLKPDAEGVPVVYICMVYNVLPTNWLSPDQPVGGTGYGSFLVFIFTCCYLNIKLYQLLRKGNKSNKRPMPFAPV